MERVRIGKDIVFQWEVRKDGAALTAEDAANLTLVIAGRNGKSQRLPFEIRDSKIIAAWYGVQQTEIGAYRLACWHNRGKVGESVVDVVWAVELVRYTTEETYDELDPVTIELEAGNLTFAALKGASAYEVAVAEGFVGTEEEWLASLKKPAEDAAEDAEEAAARAIEAAENAEAAVTRAETAAQSAENAAGNANTAAGLADAAADNANTAAGLADAAADNANTAATEAYSKAQEADTAATTATNAAQSANSAAASANAAANSAVNAAVEATESAENAQTQADNARYAADYANEMAIAAEKVNAQLNGNVLTITNRQGTSTSVNTKGEQGEQGNPGQAATISVGTTTTGAPGTSAQVTNSGTSSAAVLDFTIPQGAKGDKGDQGEPGEVTEAEMNAALALKEDKANKVTEIDDDSTDVQYGSAKAVWTAIKNAIAAIKQWAMSLFARTDGYYSRMIVGGAESVIGKENDLDAATDYVVQGSTGIAKVNEVMGWSEKWNQLIDIFPLRGLNNSAGELTVTDHKYHIKKARITSLTYLGVGSNGLPSDWPSFNSRLYKTHKYVVGIKYLDVSEGFYIIKSSLQMHSSTVFFSDNFGGLGNYTFSLLDLSVGDSFNRFPQMWLTCRISDSPTGESILWDALPIGTYFEFDDRVLCFDLTEIYGVGHEPTTVAQFEADVLAKYGKTLDECGAYDTGSINNANVESLEVYDDNNTLRAELPINIKIATGKVNGEGESVTIFPNGMRGVGTAYDSLIVDNDGWCRRAIVRMTSRAYQEGDESDTSVLTDGTTTIYSLETPIEYVLDTPILMTFNAYNGGVIRQIKGDMELATRMNIAFALNVEGFMNGASKEYINAASMQDFLSVLGTQTGGTWSMTWSEIDKKYIYVFTPNSYTNETYNNN